MWETLGRVRRGYERLLEFIVIVLMVALALVVVVAVIYRKSGMSLVWYDEIASVLLAWVSFYGAALAALRGAHIGVPGIVEAMPIWLRLPVTVLAEACVFGFFILLGWIGWEVLEVLATDYLVSIPEISVRYTQSVIPIGAFLFVLAEALVLPDILLTAAGRGRARPHAEVNP